MRAAYLGDNVGVVVGDVPVDEIGVQRGRVVLQKDGQRQRVVALAGDVHVQGARVLGAPPQVRRRRVVGTDPVQQQQLRKTAKRILCIGRCNPRRDEREGIDFVSHTVAAFSFKLTKRPW